MSDLGQKNETSNIFFEDGDAENQSPSDFLPISIRNDYRIRVALCIVSHMGIFQYRSKVAIGQNGALLHKVSHAALLVVNLAGNGSSRPNMFLGC